MPKAHRPDRPNLETTGSSRTRATNWTDSMDMIMLALMREENNNGFCQNSTFSKETWRRMTFAFNEQTMKNFSYRNLKNRLKVLKKTFNLYYNLANRSGWGWDLSLKVAIASDEQIWDDVISINKDYARIKGKPFPAYDNIDILFSRSMANGRHGDTLAMPEAVSDNDSSDDNAAHQNIDASTVRHASQPTGGVSSSSFGYLEPSDHSMSNVHPYSPSTCTSPLATETYSDARPSSSDGKRSRSSPMAPSTRRSRMQTDASDPLQALVDQGKQRLEIVNEILRREKLARPTVYSIDDCMQKLEKIPDITPDWLRDLVLLILDN